MGEGDLAALIKRIPAVARSRKSTAEALRRIRQMNRRVAKHVIERLREEREQAVDHWFATLEADEPRLDCTVDLVAQQLMDQLLQTPAPVGPPVGDGDVARFRLPTSRQR